MINTCNFCSGTCFEVSREFFSDSESWNKEVNEVVNKKLEEPIDPNKVSGFIACCKCEAINYIIE